MSNWSRQQINWMARAIRLAAKGQFTARPNPMVGCVIEKNGVLVGEGWHQQFGKAHAEVNALAMAGDKARDATAYVTLEPCSHTGKTGPCANALIDAGIKKVVIAMTDPNPQVDGGGIARLKDAGVLVECGLLEAEARQLNRGFIKRMQQGVPFVILKMAMSVDGRTAMADGKSQWITGPAARSDVQKLRAQQDAIITGSGTVLFDNPSLTVRETDAGNWWSQALDHGFRQPARILLDRSGRLQATEKVFSNNAEVHWFQNNPGTIESLVKAPHIHTRVWQDEKSLLEFCGQQQMNHVLIEAGHQLAGSFLAAGLVDELVIYMAPKLMGQKAMPLTGLAFDEMSQAIELRLTDIRMVGDDVRMTYGIAQG